jgi:type IV secretion system protein TrbL
MRAGRLLRVGIAVAVAAALTILVVGGALAQASGPVHPSGTLDAIATSYRAASRLWLVRLTGVAQQTFVTLAGIEFAISGALWGLRRDSLDDIAARFLLKFVVVSFLLFLITAFATWGPAIVDGFAAAGEQAVAGTTVSPSRVIDLGMALAGQIGDAFDTWGVVTHTMMAFVSAAAVLLIMLAYIGIATQLILTLVESYIVLGGGVLFLGFASFRATAAYSENFLNYAVSVGIKIFLLYLIVGVGTSVTTDIVRVIHTDPTFSINLTALGQVLGLALIFVVLVARIPGGVAARITASHSLGLAHALRSL